jgi:DNA-binding MarR family transcriptional regulator
VRRRSPPEAALRACLMRKTLADSRQRAAAAVLLGLTETDVLALQHLAWAGTLTPAALSARLGLSSGGTSALVGRLAGHGSVRREPHPVDRRSTVLRLSPSGAARAAEVYAPLVRQLDAAAASLRADELPAVEAYLAAVAGIAEAHAEALVRRGERERPRVAPVPAPGLWA